MEVESRGPRAGIAQGSQGWVGEREEPRLHCAPGAVPGHIPLSSG